MAYFAVLPPVVLLLLFVTGDCFFAASDTFLTAATALLTTCFVAAFVSVFVAVFVVVLPVPEEPDDPDDDPEDDPEDLLDDFEEADCFFDACFAAVLVVVVDFFLTDVFLDPFELLLVVVDVVVPSFDACFMVSCTVARIHVSPVIWISLTDASVSMSLHVISFFPLT